jgi:hypothetical protein
MEQVNLAWFSGRNDTRTGHAHRTLENKETQEIQKWKRRTIFCYHLIWVPPPLTPPQLRWTQILHDRKQALVFFPCTYCFMAETITLTERKSTLLAILFNNFGP